MTARGLWWPYITHFHNSLKSFFFVCPKDLVSELEWPEVKLNLDFEKTNILCKFQNDWATIWPLERLYFLTFWPIFFDPTRTIFKYLIEFQKGSLKKFQEVFLVSSTKRPRFKHTYTISNLTSRSSRQTFRTKVGKIGKFWHQGC